MKIRLDQIELDSKNPKQEDRIKRIANSIKAVGQVEPVKLRILPNKKYAMISGHHRYWAMKSLRRKTIDAEIEGMSEETMQVHRRVSTAFDNRQDPDIIQAIDMLKTLADVAQATKEELEKLRDEYGHKKVPMVNNFLAFARFVTENSDKNSLEKNTGILEPITVRHFLSSSPLHEYKKERLECLREASKNEWSSRVVESKSKAIKKKIEEAEEARKREEIVIAERREREIKEIKKAEGKDAKGKVKSPEVVAAEAEAKTRKADKKKAKQEDWTQWPSSKEMIDSINSIHKEFVPAWKNSIEIGKLPKEANNKLAEFLGKAIDALSQLRKELLDDAL